nr:immunoglobulin heavy chain junction region [Macaca mulatta]
CAIGGRIVFVVNVPLADGLDSW